MRAEIVDDDYGGFTLVVAAETEEDHERLTSFREWPMDREEQDKYYVGGPLTVIQLCDDPKKHVSKLLFGWQRKQDVKEVSV